MPLVHLPGVRLESRPGLRVPFHPPAVHRWTLCAWPLRGELGFPGTKTEWILNLQRSFFLMASLPIFLICGKRSQGLQGLYIIASKYQRIFMHLTRRWWRCCFLLRMMPLPSVGYPWLGAQGRAARVPPIFSNKEKTSTVYEKHQPFKFILNIHF